MKAYFYDRLLRRIWRPLHNTDFDFENRSSIYQTMRMIQAVTLVGGFGPMLTYCFEICGDKHRSMIYVLMAGIPWSLGFGFIAYIADLTRHWWTTLAIFIGITIPFPLIYICMMPESYKFLIAKKRWDDAKKSLKRLKIYFVISGSL